MPTTPSRIPKESQDCEALVKWMDLRRLRFSHVPQETFSLGRHGKNFAVLAKNKRMGVRKGVPDYVIVIPRLTPSGNVVRKEQRLLFLEMKREKAPPSAVKPEQREWIDDLNLVAGVTAKVVRGFDEAVAAIEEELKRP